MNYFSFFVLLFYSVFLFAQSSEEKPHDDIASLLRKEQTLQTDSALLDYYIEVGEYYKNKERFDSALFFFEKVVAFSEDTLTDIRLSIALNQKGNILYYQGNVSQAIDCFHRALKIAEKADKKHNVAYGLQNLAAIYAVQGYEEKAMDYYEKSIQLHRELGNKDGVALVLNNIAYYYINGKEYVKALEVLEESLVLEEELKDSIDISNLLSNIGYVYKLQKDFDKALNYFKRAVDLQQIIGADKIAVSTTYKNIGDIMWEQKEYEEAISYGEKSMTIALEIGVPNLIKNSSELLTRVYKAQGRGMEALEMSELFHEMKDSLKNEGTQKATAEQLAQYKYEKQKAIDDERNKHVLAIEKQTREKQNVIILAILVGLVMLLLFLVFTYKKLKETKEQKKTIEHQKEEVEFINQKLNHLNKEVSDSINYAELIQKAVLPTLQIEDLMKEAFIYFNPRDRVSGDFYWLEQKDEYNGYAVADCTGHGIPGAFIAMIGTILLNEIYNSKKIYVPNEILDELSRLMQLTLTNKNGVTMNDGMDISFAVLNNETKMLYFSGANNPVWIVSSSSVKRINKQEVEPVYKTEFGYLYEIKGDKQPIGVQTGGDTPFNLNSAHLQDGDVFYLFSDGYADQFGGDKGKKMKSKLFKELLVKIYQKPMHKQNDILVDHFNSWKGELEQVDDVCVLGVKI